MSPFGSVLGAVSRAANRGSRSLWQVSGNNMVYLGVTLMFMTDTGAFVFFLVLIAIILFLPSSSDPMASVPGERLELWPLTAWERRGLRVVSPLLNPLLWALLALMAWKRMTWELWAFVASLFLAGFIGSSFRMPIMWVPRIPLGILTLMVRKDLRQSLTALDLYCTLLIAVPAYWMRLTGMLPVEAHAPLTGVVITLMSTMALTLFGLDGASGVMRYRLWPISGSWVLAAKGIAYLLLILLVTLPLSPFAGLAGALIALAVGQWVSVKLMVPQSRWRFRVSKSFASSITQMVFALFGFALVSQLGVLWLVLCIGVYAISLRISGQQLSA